MVSFDPNNQISLAGSIISTSSRGPRNGDSRMKPDIGAPGASVSAEYGTGSGNTACEALAAVCAKLGIRTGIDLYGVMDVAEDLVLPMLDAPVRVDRDALTLGYAGVYSSFLLFAKRASERYGVPSRDILVRMGELKSVGGQEDLIESVAMDMARERAGR